MTDKRSPVSEREISTADAGRRQVRVAQVLFAGAATIATLALSGVASPGSIQTATAPGPPAASGIVGGGVIAVDDDNGNSVNDQGQTSGDIFAQNAQDQSTA